MRCEKAGFTPAFLLADGRQSWTSSLDLTAGLQGACPAFFCLRKIILQRTKLFRHVELLWFGRLVGQ
jgi:hypothetical protein